MPQIQTWKKNNVKQRDSILKGVFDTDFFNIKKNLTSASEFYIFSFNFSSNGSCHFSILITAKDSPSTIISLSRGFIWAGSLLDLLAQIHYMQGMLKLFWQLGETTID